MVESEFLPPLLVQGGSSSSSLDALWVRIAAFLSLKSPNTQRTYSSVITEWAAFLKVTPGASGSAARLLAVNEMHALSYRKWLESRPGQKPRYRGAEKVAAKPEKAISTKVRKTKATKLDGMQSTLGNATIAKKLVVLRRIYRLLIASEFFHGKNPFDQEHLPVPAARSGRKRPTEMIPYESVRELLKLPDNSTPKGLRDQVILALLFGAGLRRSEVLSLRLGDLRVSSKGTHFLKLRSTKGKTDADQTIPAWAATALQELVTLRKQQGAGDLDYLINSYRGPAGQTPTAQALSDSGLYRLFCSYCRQAGIQVPASPHSARATAITRLLDDGLSHREVQEFSRHASVQMVETYDKRRYGVEKNPGKNIKY